MYSKHSPLFLLFIVPNAKRVVYSTCSIHAQDNEQVVGTVLKDNSDFTLAARSSVLPTWKRRGLPSEFDGNDQGNKFIF